MTNARYARTNTTKYAQHARRIESNGLWLYQNKTRCHLRSCLYTFNFTIWLWTMLLRAPSGVPFNVGSPHEITIAGLARRVAGVTSPGTEIRVAGTPTPGAAPQRYVPDTARAGLQLGLRAWISLEDGIRRTFDWHARQRMTEAVLA